MIRMLVTVGTVTHTGNLIEEKRQAFLCSICDICER